ncbi:MAG: DUF167 family protein [Candidatus Taylorbacteria bacterium]|nr:DUF167 family protein [Candidatus Taylorbacteria bacterium]
MPLYLKITVRPDSAKESIKEQENGRFAISVKEPAEDNRANRRILAMIKKLYPKEPVKIVAGHHSPRKTILIGNE